MARPKKKLLAPVADLAEAPHPQIAAVTEALNPEVTTPTVEVQPPTPVLETPEPVKVTLTVVQAPLQQTSAPVPSARITVTNDIFPDTDKSEMDRYICVIKNCEAAMRISDLITHQRDLGLWGVHQYDNNSRNTFARSFYFRERVNAVKALNHAISLR